MTASEDTRVGIKAAFPVKKRELNGLNRVAAYLNDNRADRIPVVGYVEFTKHTETIDGDEMTVALMVVEPVVDAQGRSFKGYADDVRRMVEDMRKSAGKASVAETLFDGAQRRDVDEQLDGQIELVDVTSGTGDDSVQVEAGRVVPEKSAGELAAERAEGVPAAEQTVADEATVGVVKPGYVARADADRENKLTGAGVTAAAVLGKPADEVRQDRKDVEGGIVRPARKARGATVRPNTDPFTPDPAA
jgi:hypothetical protein